MRHKPNPQRQLCFGEDDLWERLPMDNKRRCQELIRQLLQEVVATPADAERSEND